MNRIRVFLIATCLLAVTPPLFGDIILVSRLSDAEVFTEPPQSQTGFLPANLCSEGYRQFAMGVRAGASSTSNSSILINSPMEGLRVVGNGTASAETYRFAANASAKLIVLSFTLTEVSYPYSITGQLNGASCSTFSCSMATAKLTGETGTIFERVGTTLSESGTLPPGNYTLSVDVHASTTAFNQAGSASSSANFTFALDGPMSTPTPTPPPTPVTRATNLSTRLLVGTGNGRGIGGFIITGNGPRHLLLRGIGPSLSGVLANTLPDPSLTLNRLRCNSQNLTNNNWRDTQEAEIIATGRAPSNDLESAIVADLPPGAYTAILADTAGTTGVGLVEIYDLSTNQDSRLANISTRGNVGTGDDIMIAGFILGAASDEDSIVLRGIGPSLYGYVPDNLLADPRLELRDSNGELIIGNDNWMDDPNQAAIIQAVGLAPGNNLESAIAATLMPGPYTALLSGMNNGTGVGLVEVYENPPTPAPSPTPTPVPTPTPTPCCADDSWRATTLNGAPMARSNPVSVWTGTEMIVWGGIYPLTNLVFDTGGRYNPETDSWTATSVVNVPDARVNSTAIWTGSEMIVWGGTNYNLSLGGFNTGGRYDPVSDTWTATNLTNAPTARFRHTAVWTGTEMIVWGGGPSFPYGTVFNTGARYNPVTDTWSPISTVNAPSPRFLHTAVWTGSEMIVWGGSAPTNPMNTGGRYNPLTDSWAPVSAVNAPSARTGHTTVWTGQEMIVWGGSDGANVLNTGARYDPNSNSWLATGIGPEGRANHSAVWTGNEMIIWAGATASLDTFTGSRYNPDTDTWRAMKHGSPPLPRTGHAAVWSGHQMIVWGGFAMVTSYPNPQHLVVNDGGRYFASPPPTPSPPRLPLPHLQRADPSLFRNAQFFRDIAD